MEELEMQFSQFDSNDILPRASNQSTGVKTKNHHSPVHVDNFFYSQKQNNHSVTVFRDMSLSKMKRTAGERW